MAKQKSKSKSKPHNKPKPKKHPSRSSSTTSADDAQFRATLLDQGHLVREMQSDGNCLFRSLSDQLHRDSGARHALVRNEICNHLSRHRECFECFLLMNDEDEDVVDFDEYVAKMREDGEWGGNVELVAASRVWRRDVRIFSGLYDGGVMLIQCQEGESNDRCNNDKNARDMKKSSYQEYEEHEGIVNFGDLLLSYHENDHYNSVHPINDKQSTTKKERSHDGNNNSSNNNTTTKEAAPMALSLKSASKTKPRKGADCPCGSGIKYKKCCAAKQKSAARARAVKLKDGGEEEDEKKDELGDGFKVLTI